MDIVKELATLLGPSLLVLFPVSLLALRREMNRTKRLEKNIKETNLRILGLTAIIVKYCAAPIEVVLDQLKEQRDLLTEIPQDDILGEILDKYTRS